VTVTLNEIPRLSSASAMSSADRVDVPRSITFDNRCVAPVASAGSHTDPARTAMLMVTAGVVGVCFASTTAPLGRTERAGTRPGDIGQETGKGSNHPTVRFEEENTVRAAVATCSSVTAAIRGISSLKTSTLAIVSK
jgi:hypothetical protein